MKFLFFISTLYKKLQLLFGKYILLCTYYFLITTSLVLCNNDILSWTYLIGSIIIVLRRFAFKMYGLFIAVFAKQFLLVFFIYFALPSQFDFHVVFYFIFNHMSTPIYQHYFNCSSNVGIDSQIINKWTILS